MKKTMRTLIKLSLLSAVIFASASAVAADLKIAPYYSLSFTEGITVPNKGNWMFSANLVNDLGLIVQPSEKHRIIGFYELKYTGPGFRKQEGEKFSDRAMDHIMVLRHHYNFMPEYTLKTQFDYMTEYKRTGTNEVWCSGLYDFNRAGGSLGLERKINADLKATAQLQYHFLSFPNYTDLLSEFQTGGEDAEASTGKQNHGIIQAGLKATYKDINGGLDVSMLNYQKQKVITDSIQADGTYYSAELQKDMTIAFSADYTRKLWDLLVLTPSLGYKIKTSNQNYQHFTVATSTVPVKYIGKYYDYQELSIVIPVSVMLGSRWEYFFNTEWDWRFYSARPPRDMENNFVDGTQGNSLMIVSTGFTLKPNEVTRTVFYYGYQSQTSNMKFEKYLPYNYDGHSFGISFNYSY